MKTPNKDPSPNIGHKKNLNNNNNKVKRRRQRGEKHRKRAQRFKEYQKSKYTSLFLNITVDISYSVDAIICLSF